VANARVSGSDGRMLPGGVAYVRVSRSDGGMLHGDRMVSMRVSRSRNSNANSRVSKSDGGMLHGGRVVSARVSRSRNSMRTRGCPGAMAGWCLAGW
jgi:hypothetical protein